MVIFNSYIKLPEGDKSGDVFFNTQFYGTQIQQHPPRSDSHQSGRTYRPWICNSQTWSHRFCLKLGDTPMFLVCSWEKHDAPLDFEVSHLLREKLWQPGRSWLVLEALECTLDSLHFCAGETFSTSSQTRDHLVKSGNSQANKATVGIITRGTFTVGTWELTWGFIFSHDQIVNWGSSSWIPSSTPAQKKWKGGLWDIGKPSSKWTRCFPGIGFLGFQCHGVLLWIWNGRMGLEFPLGEPLDQEICSWQFHGDQNRQNLAGITWSVETRDE